MKLMLTITFLLSIFSNSSFAECDVYSEHIHKAIRAHFSSKMDTNISKSIQLAKITPNNTAIYIAQFKKFDHQRKEFRIYNFTTTVECDPQGRPYFSGDMDWSFALSDIPEAQAASKQLQ